VLFAVLFGAWLLMSGHYTPLLVGLGIASCTLATIAADRIGATDKDGLPLHLMLRLPVYLLWLFWEIIKSNLATGGLILGGRVRPVMFSTQASQKTSSGVVTYANSITLTPGTVTVQVVEGESQRKPKFLVHALVPAFQADVESGGMDSKVAWLEAGRRK